MAILSSSPVRSLTATPYLLPHVLLDGGVHVESPATHGPVRDDPAERDDRRLRGATADVDDHAADRFVDLEPGTDGCGHRLFDEMGGRRPRTTGRLLDRPSLHRGDGRRHAEQYPGPVELGDARPSQEEPDRSLGDVEVGDGTLAERPDGDDRSPAYGRSAAGPRRPRRAPRGCVC